ncbi:metallophosphoesterase family protein [Ottowia testudinis]|uniref:Metallophosphoesterase family protein n=1 Tax=Ottowia testudinis TaxID=2816950 RepID=A0A975CJT7_9BURK|nr:metallophosphoesterase [Ottowia testudinis]QTD47136.1 metallophosphoesterase family protein [Ottowia testudinis]
MILHITDPHFGTERPAVVAALIALARQRRPGQIVLSGDITQRARPAQFAAARDFVQRLCDACGIDAVRDVLVIPGNHDIPLFNLPLRLADPYGRFCRAFGARLNPMIRTPQAWLIGVNTTRLWRHKHGEVSTAQIERVAARLRAAPDGALRVVVTHQPLMVIERGDRRDLVRGHRAAIRAWVAAGADLFLSGHTHQSFVAPLLGDGRQAWVVQTGTAVSRRVREHVPNSVHLIDWPGESGGARVVERWDCSGERFERVACTQIALSHGMPALPLG